MIELIYNFLGFCLVIILPMFITIGFTIMKNYYDEKKYKAGYYKGYNDGTIDALEVLINGKN